MTRKMTWLIGLLILPLAGCDQADNGETASRVTKIAEQTAADTTRDVVKALGQSRPRAVWDAMPASYQKDVNDLVGLFAEKMDPDVYDKTFSLLGKIGKVLRTKRQFFLGHPMIQANQSKSAGSEANWDAAVDLLDTITKSDISTLEAIKTLNVPAFLDKTGTKLMEHLAEASKLSPQNPMDMLKQITIKAGPSQGENQVLSITAPEQPTKEVEFTKVDGRWVPVDLARQWPETIAEAKQKLTEISDEELEQSKSQALMAIAMADGIVDQLHAVDTQAKFNQIVGQMMAMVLGQMMSGAQTPPPGF